MLHVAPATHADSTSVLPLILMQLTVASHDNKKAPWDRFPDALGIPP